MLHYAGSTPSPSSPVTIAVKPNWYQWHPMAQAFRNTWFPFTFPRSDFLGNYEVPGPYLGSALGFMTVGGDNESLFWRQASYFEHVRKFFSGDWDFTVSDNSRENPIVHVNPRGMILGNINPMDYSAGYELLSACTTCTPPTLLTSSKRDTGIAAPMPSYIMALEDRAIAGEFNLVPIPAPYNLYSVKHLRVYQQGNWYQIVVGWHMRNPWNSLCYHYGVVETYNFIVSLKPGLNLENPTAVNTLIDVSLQLRRVQWQASRVACSYNIWTDKVIPYLNTYVPFQTSPPVVWTGNSALDTLCLEPPRPVRIPDLLGWDKASDRYTDNGPSSLQRFRKQVDEIIPDATALTFFSSKAAVDSFLDVSASNFLEPLGEIQELLGVFDIYDLLLEVKKLKKRPAEILLGMFDILTSAKLLYSFGIAPTVGDAKEIARLAKQPVGRFKELLQPRKTRDSYPFVTDGVTLKALKGTVRSRLSLRVRADSFLPNLVPLTQLGILPSYSNLWDLVPFSFVLDKFFNVGESLDVFESSLAMFAMECTSSWHTLELWRELEEAELGIPNETSDIVRQPLSYHYYSRFQSNGVPPLLPTRLWTPVGSLDDVNWAVYGSLLYQVFKP